MHSPKLSRALVNSTLNLIFLVILFGSNSFGGASAFPGDDPPTPTPSNPSIQATPTPPIVQNDPARGLIYDGLVLATSGPCKGLFQIRGSDLCTHGPDPAPPGVNISSSPPPVPAGAVSSVQCDGDGTTGFRVQVIYAHASDVSDGYNTYLSSFQHWAGEADAIFDDSAAETGGTRRIRFVHDANCDPIVLNVTLTPAGDDNFGNTINELIGLGFDRVDRKYMVFVDAYVLCGIGTIAVDDRPGPENWNNVGPGYGRIDVMCWGYGGQVEAHELMHNLGGVQLSAPHTSGGWHCVDEWDQMCYSDQNPILGIPPMQYLCPDPSHNRLFDCNHDDYYHTNALAGNYLATHWNTANSSFLIGGGPPPPPPCLPSSLPPRSKLVSPKNKAAVRTTTPTLDWRDVAEKYCADYYVGVWNFNGQWVAGGLVSASSYSVPGGILLPKNKYSWCVWAHNALGYGDGVCRWFKVHKKAV